MLEHDNILYIEKRKHSTENLLQLTNQFSKVAVKKNKHTKTATF